MEARHQKQEHTHSYYAATAAAKTDYPMLSEAIDADVCIIGAGFTGVATALTLAERGCRVAIVEANRIGWGASGRNGGQLINGFSSTRRIAQRHGHGVADLLWELGWRGNEIIRERVARYAIDCDLKNGYVDVATRPRQLAAINAAAEDRARRNFPYPYEIWDRDKTRDLLGTDAFYGGLYCSRDGHVHPLNLCSGEARAAESLGTAIFEQSPVTNIRHGKRPIVETGSGSVMADAVLIAGNAYSRLEPRHLSKLVFPAGSYIIATEPLSDDLVQAINPRDVAACDMNHINQYFRLSADQRLLFGGACNYSGRDPDDIASYIRPRMLDVYPQLADLRIDYQWGGKIGVVLNRSLTVGRIHGNVYYCQGYSGHGLCPSHLMGEIMADAIQGTMERYDLFADIPHLRIPGSRWIGNQLIAIGMLYYKLKDRL